MSGMVPFTYDAESIELEPEEYAAYGQLVMGLCYHDEQHAISSLLASVKHKQGFHALDALQRQARKMWRTEAKL